MQSLFSFFCCEAYALCAYGLASGCFGMANCVPQFAMPKYALLRPAIASDTPGNDNISESLIEICRVWPSPPFARSAYREIREIQPIILNMKVIVHNCAGTVYFSQFENPKDQKKDQICVCGSVLLCFEQKKHDFMCFSNALKSLPDNF